MNARGEWDLRKSFPSLGAAFTGGQLRTVKKAHDATTHGNTAPRHPAFVEPFFLFFSGQNPSPTFFFSSHYMPRFLDLVLPGKVSGESQLLLADIRVWDDEMPPRM